MGMGRRNSDVYLEGSSGKGMVIFILLVAIVGAVIGVLIITNLVSPSDDPRNIEVINFTKQTVSPTSTPIVVNSTTSKGLKIHFMNVGQADCAMIEHDGRYAFVDVGKSSKGTYYTTIRQHEPESAEWVLSSHQDTDHIGNVVYLMQGCAVSKYYDNGVGTNTLTYREVMEKVASDNMEYVILREGNTINTWNDVKITAVAVNSSGGKDLNDDSIVLRLEYDGVVVGFAGDISEDVDADVGKKLGDVDILKVAHHGAETSSSDDFLSYVKPELSIISVGQNTYGHPSEEAIKRLENYGNVYRTDNYGCVEVIIENGNYRVVKCDV